MSGQFSWARQRVAVRAHENHGVGGLCKIRAVWTVQPTPKSAKRRMFVANCHNTNMSNYSMLTN